MQGGRTFALQFQRFTRLNRTLHILMIVSFISLALTGMTLKFSYTGWAAFIARRLGGYEAAGFVHRAAATLMFGALRHPPLGPEPEAEAGVRRLLPEAGLRARLDALQQAGPRRARGEPQVVRGEGAPAPVRALDLLGEVRLLRGLLGDLRDRRPRASCCGSRSSSRRFLPGWLINVATIVHSDEALLATGFIFTVHFFNTHLRPEKFPMDTVVFTGRMPVDEWKRDKPAEYEAVVAAGKLEENLVEPYQPVVIRTIRVFAWTALAIGTAIVLWIVYAMLFAYR